MSPEEDLRKIRQDRDLSVTDIVSVDPLSPGDLDLIFSLSRKFRGYGTYKFNFNKGCSMVHAFFESSTRTLSSFDLAAKNLSMDTNSVSSGGSSLNKGEGFLDTILTLDAYNLKAITIRSRESGVPEMMARHTNAAIINAGDGWHEHPTQALLDSLTMLDHFGGGHLEGKSVTIVGDVRHSRVFGSLVRILRTLKADIRVCAPETLLPAGIENFEVQTFYDVEDGLKNADVVYALRVQEERGSGGYIPTLREYSKMFGISRERLNLAAQNAILMHPGPVRRDVDIHSALVTLDEKSHILNQVENGMAVRKALLWLLCDRYDGKRKEIRRL